MTADDYINFDDDEDRDPPVCEGCGWTHNGMSARCRLPKYPNRHDPDHGLDFSVDAPAPPVAPPADPWLERRMHSFGGSEIPALLIALGIVQPTPTTPKYVTRLASKLFAIKAGTRKPERVGGPAEKGNTVEAELIRTWSSDAWSGYPAAIHASAAPKEWLPLIDRHCPRLSCTPDAWLYDPEYVNVQTKTDVHGGKRAPTREWVQQVQGEMAVTGASRSVIVYGGGWANTWRENAREHPIAFEVQRDEGMIEVIRGAAREGWKRVETILQGREPT